MTTPTITPTDERSFAHARRVHHALTAEVEKRALQWMAARMPRWVTSDGLTLVGFTAQIGAGVSYALARYHRCALLLAVFCLVLNWFGDSMDGTVARVRDQQRPRYGFYVDHMADILGAVAMMGGLACSGFVHWQIAAAMLIAFLLLSAESYLATYTLSRFELSQGLFGPTEIRILLAIGTLALLRSPYSTIFGRRMLLFDCGGGIATICMAATAILLTISHTGELYREEPLA